MGLSGRPLQQISFRVRVLVPVNSPTCGREKSLNSFTFPSTQRTKRSNDAFRTTQHSGIYRPVHTGINYIFEVLCALRPWRRRESDSYTAASVPFRCVPPPRGTTAPPYPGTPFFVVQLPTALRPPGCPFVQGRPPADVEARPSSSSTWYTLRHSLHVLWPRAGSSTAAILVLYIHLSLNVIHASSSSLSSGAAWWIPGGDNGQDEVHHRQGVPYRRAVQEITNDIHVVARRRLGFFVKRKCRESATHRRSASGALRGLVLCLAFSWGFLLCFFSPRVSLGLCVLGVVCVCLAFCSRTSFPTALLLSELMNQLDSATQLVIKGRRPMRAFSSPRHLG